MLNRNKNKTNPARALLAYSEGLKNFLGTLKTPANTGAKSYTQKGVGCLRNGCENVKKEKFLIKNAI